MHWADITANRIIGQKGDRSSEPYVLAAGITPSGTVHFGNFREVITVDLIARALRKRGKKVRFIFSWDDFDTFRKVPANMPNKEKLEKYLFTPIVDTPDPFEVESSYASHHEKDFESQLQKVGINAEFLYQAQKYRAGEYKDAILKCLKKTDQIKSILNKYRSKDLEQNWLPISIYSHKENTDQMQELTWDQDQTISYKTKNGEVGQLDLSKDTNIKLPWRLDWPMRWSYEKVDFEPGGKDHSSQGGSYTTAKELASEIFDFEPPIYLQYDFVSIKGGSGKMSSSSGELVTLRDVLKVYEPEMVRWIFASYKTNIDFSVSFDLDVIKTYEDFDRMERVVYGLEDANEKRTAMAKRVYELSQLEDGEIPATIPFQPSFRHLTNILQINSGDIEQTRKYYSDKIVTDRDKRRFDERCSCALFWLKNYAPDDFKFEVNSTSPSLQMSKELFSFFENLGSYLKESWDEIVNDKDLHDKMYEYIHLYKLEPAQVFLNFYQILIGRERGPKLAGFVRSIGQERVSFLIDDALKKSKVEKSL